MWRNVDDEKKLEKEREMEREKKEKKSKFLDAWSEDPHRRGLANPNLS